MLRVYNPSNNAGLSQDSSKKNAAAAAEKFLKSIVAKKLIKGGKNWGKIGTASNDLDIDNEKAKARVKVGDTYYLHDNDERQRFPMTMTSVPAAYIVKRINTDNTDKTYHFILSQVTGNNLEEYDLKAILVNVQTKETTGLAHYIIKTGNNDREFVLWYSPPSIAGGNGSTSTSTAIPKPLKRSRKGAKSNDNNKWVTFVKAYALEHGIPFGAAMKEARSLYVSNRLAVLKPTQT